MAGAALGGVLAVLLVLGGAAIASSPSGVPQSVLDATHLPPLLRPAGRPIELRYDVHCAPAGEAPADAPCDATGSVFVAAAGSGGYDAGAYRQLPLRIDVTAAEGRYVADVPRELASRREGFAYYAVFRSASADRTFTLPAGGPSAPQLSLPLVRPIEVDLGVHVFGDARRPDVRVAEASWGDEPDDVGLEESRGLPPVGGSSFDVARDGTVHLLDQVHGRILRWSPGSQSADTVRVSIDPHLADLAVADDGSSHVLELAVSGRRPRLRTFDVAGREAAAVELAERTASQVRLAGNRPVVLQQPSGQWMQAEDGGLPLSPALQKASGRPGRLVPGIGEVVLVRIGNEIRVAVVGERGLLRAWHITSETPIAEVQLAEPVAGRLVLVAREYTDAGDEFTVLVLGEGGLVQRFAVASAAWAETAPLSRFRLRGSSLYRLGSSRSGVFVDRFDLEVM